MELIKQLLNLNESAQEGLKGWLSFFAYGADSDFESVFVFKDETKAKSVAKQLNKKYAGTDWAVKTSKTADDHHLVLVLDHRQDIDEILFIAFADSESACKQITTDLIDSGDIMGAENIEASEIEYNHVE